ncbi:TPA: AbrB/MazE/SpoVT family DNA-binding domain-containing protein [Clostridium botulinum]|nr:AbrB/MazE/SpoVT family DNA-binding domain-containing protein [Clostridium botulinum]
MKGIITFNKSGSGSKSGRLTIPVAFLELLGITEDDRNVNITFEDGKLIIEKVVKDA